MKTYFKVLGLAGLLAFSIPAMAQLSSKTEVATPELAAQREELKKQVTQGYLDIKNSLVKSDSAGASKAALAFTTSLKKFKFKKLTLDQMNEATATRAELIALADEIAKTQKINQQRKALGKLSTKFWPIAAKFKPENMPLYQQVCPMTGETWLSDVKEIQNPYYPKNMLTCGEVKASL